MASTYLQNMVNIREQGLDEKAIRSVVGITHLAGADTVSMIGCDTPTSTILKSHTDRLRAEHVLLGHDPLSGSAEEGTSRNRSRHRRGSAARLFGLKRPAVLDSYAQGVTAVESARACWHLTRRNGG